MNRTDRLEDVVYRLIRYLMQTGTMSPEAADRLIREMQDEETEADVKVRLAEWKRVGK